MRHVYANRAAYLLAALLVVATALFAWLRSEGGTLVAVDRAANDDAVTGASAETVYDEVDGWAWRELGEQVFVADCQACHARLTHPPELFAAEGGRAYLIDLVLYGFEGEMVIDDSARSVEHPAFAGHDDQALAAVLNHVLVSWDNVEDLPDEPQLYRPDDVDDARDRDLSPEEVAERRPPA
jgi:mono/diheme cytochrome c family protein